MTVALRPVRDDEYDEFFALFAAYYRELDAFDPDAERDSWDAERHRAAILDDMTGRDIDWIEADGERAGFVMVRTDPDWPREDRDVAEIAEFYVLPAFRRRGIGSAAVREVLADHRRRGTHAVEASILPDNDAARAFWAALGFETRAIVTARRP